MSYIGDSLNNKQILHHWDNTVDNTVFKQNLFDTYQIPKNEIDEAGNKIHKSSCELRENIIQFQGLVMELQRRAGRTEKYDQNLYSEINRAIRNLNELMLQLKLLTDQAEYTKEIVDAVKISQELADGFEQSDSKQETQYGYISSTDKAKLDGIAHSHTVTSTSNGTTFDIK